MAPRRFRSTAGGKPIKSMLAGASSIDLFPTAMTSLSLVDPNGLHSDWQRVGADMRHAMNVWSRRAAAPDDSELERESA